MRPKLEEQFTFLERHPPALLTPGAIARLIDLWQEAYPEPSLEDSAWWDGQQRMARIALELTRYSWRSAKQLTTLIHHEGLREKTIYRCHMRRQELAKELALDATERAVCIAFSLPQEFRTDTLLYIAEQLFPIQPNEALRLYRQINPDRWAAESFLRRIAIQDWRMALSLAEDHGLNREDSFLCYMIGILVRHDFALAEEMALQISPAGRSQAVAVLIHHLPPIGVAEILSLMEHPLYASNRIQIFARFMPEIRQYCGLPTEEVGGLLRPDDELFWGHLREVLKRTETDLAWALDQVRAVGDYERRRFLFAYVAAEFCQTR